MAGKTQQEKNPSIILMENRMQDHAAFGNPK